MTSDGEKLMTLDEAKLELAREECAKHGHSYDVMENGGGIPVRLTCHRCWLSWDVAT